MLEPIKKTIEVPCNQETAFGVFVEEMASWWPLDKRSMSMHSGQAAKTLRVDAQVGGKVIEVSEDGTEHWWGSFKTYDPFSSLSMDFHMGLAPENASLVEVAFTALNEERTQVELTQSNFEAFGDMAEMMYNGYGSGWALIFEDGYKAACGG